MSSKDTTLLSCSSSQRSAQTSDKNTSYGVRLVGLDKTADLALLKIVKPPPGLTAVKLGELSSIQVAEDIHIIGHPHGNLWSYSTGVISQIRDQYGWKYTDGSEHLARVLQMQTAINPGNSGGPVLDNNANMLGLVAMSEEGQNLNYAVAIDTIRTFVTTSLANKTRGSGDAYPNSRRRDLYRPHQRRPSCNKNRLFEFCFILCSRSKGFSN